MTVSFYCSEEKECLKFRAELFPLDKTPEVINSDAEMPDFLRNLGVVTEPESQKVADYFSDARDRRNHIRYQTFIPEYTEPKKQRLNYAWLASSAATLGELNSSPPMLRTRGRRNNGRSNSAEERATAAAVAAATATAAPSKPSRRRTHDEIAAAGAAAAAIDAMMPRKRRKRRPPAALLDGSLAVEMPAGLRSASAVTTSNSNSNSRATTPDRGGREFDDAAEDDAAEAIEEKVMEAEDGNEALDDEVTDYPEESSELPDLTAIVPKAERAPSPEVHAQAAPVTTTPVQPGPAQPRVSERRKGMRLYSINNLGSYSLPKVKCSAEKMRKKMGEDREDMESELKELEQKSEDLKAQIDGNGLTVKTRVSTKDT